MLVVRNKIFDIFLNYICLLFQVQPSSESTGTSDVNPSISGLQERMQDNEPDEDFTQEVSVSFFKVL